MVSIAPTSGPSSGWWYDYNSRQGWTWAKFRKKVEFSFSISSRYLQGLFWRGCLWTAKDFGVSAGRSRTTCYWKSKISWTPGRISWTESFWFYQEGKCDCVDTGILAMQPDIQWMDKLRSARAHRDGRNWCLSLRCHTFWNDDCLMLPWWMMLPIMRQLWMLWSNNYCGLRNTKDVFKGYFS